MQAIAEQRNTPGSRGFAARVRADYIILTLCWGARRGEASTITWADVDFEREFVVFRDPKNRRDHVFPLTAGCAAILKLRQADNEKPRGRDLRKIQRGEECPIPEWVFPSPMRGKHISDPSTGLEVAMKTSGLKIRMHDLRRTFAGDVAVDVLDSKGSGDFRLVKLAMNHAEVANDITQGYIAPHPKLKMLRPIYESHERRIFEAAGLQHFLPKKDGDDDLAVLVEVIKQKSEDPKVAAAFRAILDGPASSGSDE